MIQWKCKEESKDSSAENKKKFLGKLGDVLLSNRAVAKEATKQNGCHGHFQASNNTIVTMDVAKQATTQWMPWRYSHKEVCSFRGHSARRRCDDPTPSDRARRNHILRGREKYSRVSASQKMNGNSKRPHVRVVPSILLNNFKFRT